MNTLFTDNPLWVHASEMQRKLLPVILERGWRVKSIGLFDGTWVAVLLGPQDQKVALDVGSTDGADDALLLEAKLNALT